MNLNDAANVVLFYTTSAIPKNNQCLLVIFGCVVLGEIGKGFYAVQLSLFDYFQVLRLHIDESDTKKEATRLKSDLATIQRRGLSSLQTGIWAGAIILTGIGVTAACLKRSTM